MENVFSKNPLERFFGGGTPAYGTGHHKRNNVGIWQIVVLEWLGIIGLSWIIGSTSLYFDILGFENVVYII